MEDEEDATAADADEEEEEEDEARDALLHMEGHMMAERKDRAIGGMPTTRREIIANNNDKEDNTINGIRNTAAMMTQIHLDDRDPGL